MRNLYIFLALLLGAPAIFAQQAVRYPIRGIPRSAQTPITIGSGTGDVTGQASSVDSEIALFSGTGGKTIKRATGSGFVRVSSGVYQSPAELSGDVVTSSFAATIQAASVTLAKMANLANGRIICRTTSGTGVPEACTAAEINAILGTLTTSSKADVIQASLFCADAGSTDTYACNLSPAITGYVTGTHYRFKANTANTGAASVNFNSIGACTIKKVAGGITTDLATNDIRVGQVVEVAYDGTNCQMQSLLGNAPTAGGASSAFSGCFGTAPSFSATPTFDLAAVSDQSPCVIQPEEMSANVAAVTFSNIPADGGARFAIEWLQPTMGSPFEVDYDGAASNTCPISPRLGSMTRQWFVVDEDGTTIKGDGCTSDEPAIQDGYTTTATAAGTTTLTVNSTRTQRFTGSTTQTVALPVTSTMSLGNEFEIVNDSTGAVTVNSSGGNAVLVLAGGTKALLKVILTSGTTAASWDYTYWGAIITSGKVVSVGGTVTFSVTDGSTVALGAGGTVVYTSLTSSTTQAGIIEAAIDTEVSSGSDAGRAVTPNALRGSTIFGVRVVEVELFSPGTANATGDGKAYFRIPASLNGFNLIGIAANVYTAGTTGTVNVDIARCAAAATGNVCSGTVSDVLSTNLTIDSGENSSSTAAAAAVIDTGQDDVATGQLYRFDVDAVHTTPAQGLILELTFQLP